MEQNSYAKGIIDAAGFKFKVQPLNSHSSRLDIKRLSGLDIDRVIRDVNTEILSSFVEDLVWCEINESDLKLYGDITVVKLIRVTQLIIEYLAHAKDTLALNLNSLAKKLLSPQQQLRVTPLGLKESLPTDKTTSICSYSQWPSHERTPIASPTLDAESEDTSSNVTNTLKNDSFHLHIISSTNALYLRMNVEDSITVQNLKNKLISRLLPMEDACKTNFDSHALFYKDNELKDSSRTLNDYRVGDGAAIVYMRRQQAFDVASFSVSNEIESKLEKLTTIAATSYEELLLATRAFQFQLSMQEASKEAFFHEVRNLVHDALRSQECQAVIAGDISTHEETHTSSQKPSILDEVKDTNEEHHTQDVTLTASEQSKEPIADLHEYQEPGDVPHRVDVSAEGFNVVVSPFHPSVEIDSPFKMSCMVEMKQNIETTDETGKVETPKSTNRPINADLEIEFSMNSLNSMLDGIDEVIDKRAVTPAKGYLLYHGNADPDNDVASGKVKNNGSSDEMLAEESDLGGIAETVNQYNATVLKISSGRITTSDVDDDMQSISFSHSELEKTSHHAEINMNKSKQGAKKKGHFYLLKKVTKGLLLFKK